MITTFLIEHPWLSPTALALLVILGPFVGRWLIFRPRLAWCLTGISLLPVAFLTLLPVDRQLFICCEVAWALPTVGRVELAANVVLFVAPVLLAGVAARHPMLVLIAGSGLSVAIELLHALVPELGRSCSTNDWLSNTIGATIGSALAWVALSLARRSSSKVIRGSHVDIGCSSQKRGNTRHRQLRDRYTEECAKSTNVRRYFEEDVPR